VLVAGAAGVAQAGAVALPHRALELRGVLHGNEAVEDRVRDEVARILAEGADAAVGPVDEDRLVGAPEQIARVEVEVAEGLRSCLEPAGRRLPLVTPRAGRLEAQAQASAHPPAAAPTRA